MVSGKLCNIVSEIFRIFCAFKRAAGVPHKHFRYHDVVFFLSPVALSLSLYEVLIISSHHHQDFSQRRCGLDFFSLCSFVV